MLRNNSVAISGAGNLAVNYEFPDPDCDLEILADRSYPLHERRLLITAHGSGRVNSTLLLKVINP